MERILVLFISLFSISTMAAQPGPTPQIVTNSFGTTVGSTIVPPSMIVGTGINGIFTLTVGDVSAALVANDYYPLYKNGSPYFVTTGNHAFCWNAVASNSGAGDGFQFVSATQPFGYAVTVIVGGVWQGGQANKYPNIVQTGSILLSVPGTYTFNGGTFAGIQNQAATAATVHIDCAEL